MWLKSLAFPLHNFSPEPSLHLPKMSYSPCLLLTLLTHLQPLVTSKACSLLSWSFHSIFASWSQIHMLPASLLPLSTKIRKWMNTLTTEDFSGWQYQMMFTEFPLHLRSQFLNLTDLIKFSYVMTESKDPVIISQLLLKRQQ